MPRRSTARSAVLTSALAALAALALLGCRGPGAQQIVGPDGSPMLHVHCGGDQATCFQLAGTLCPAGYEMQPVFASREGNFLVRCREGLPAAQLAHCPAPAAPSALAGAAPPAKRIDATTSGANDGWPPASEPWPPAYPWPPPEASVSVSPGAPLPPTTRSESGQVDLGY